MKQYIKYSIAALAGLLILSGIFISCANDVTDTIEKESFKFFASFTGEAPNQRFGLVDEGADGKGIKISWTTGHISQGADVIQIFHEDKFITESEFIAEVGSDTRNVQIMFPSNNQMEVGKIYTAYAMNSASHKALPKDKYANEAEPYKKIHKGVNGHPLQVITNEAYWKGEFELKKGENKIDFKGNYAVVAVKIKHPKPDITGGFKKATLKLGNESHEIELIAPKPLNEDGGYTVYFNVAPGTYKSAEVDVTYSNLPVQKLTANLPSSGEKFEEWKFYQREMIASTPTCPDGKKMYFEAVSINGDKLYGKEVVSDNRVKYKLEAGESGHPNKNTYEIYQKNWDNNFEVKKVTLTEQSGAIKNPTFPIQNYWDNLGTYVYEIQMAGKQGDCGMVYNYIEIEVVPKPVCPEEDESYILVDGLGKGKLSDEPISSIGVVDTYTLKASKAGEGNTYKISRTGNEDFTITYNASLPNGQKPSGKLESNGSIQDYWTSERVGQEAIYEFEITGKGCANTVYKTIVIKIIEDDDPEVGVEGGAPGFNGNGGSLDI